MSSFTTPLIVEPINSKEWELKEEFEYHIGYKDSDFFIRVPAGFVTDFATVPRIFWWLLPPWGKYGKACVVHDYMCMYKYIYRRTPNGVVKMNIPRAKADKIFLEAMEVLKVNKPTRLVMYYAVRAYAVLFPNWV